MASITTNSLILLTVSTVTIYAVWADQGHMREQLAQTGERLYQELRQRQETPAAPRPDSSDALYLTIEAIPSHADVRIMNITPAYRPGMQLPEGRYDIEVSAPGYQTLRTWVTLDLEHQHFRARLKPEG
jgi:hypothetical protein